MTRINSRRITHKPLIMSAASLVLLLAWWVRLAYFNELRAMFPDFSLNQPFCGLDGKPYQNFAQGILDGFWPGYGPFTYMILYPYYLATVYAAVGVNLKAAVLLQSLLEVVTCAALYGMGRLTFNRPVGLLAAALCAFYSPLIFFKPCFDQVNLTTPAFSLAIFFLLKARASTRLLYFVPAGVMMALTGLSRPNIFALGLIVGLWLLFTRRGWRRLFLEGMVYGATIFLITLPVSWHNYQSGYRFSPTPVSGWEALFTGNNPVAEGLDMTDYVLYNYIDLPGAHYIKAVIEAEEQTKTAYRAETLNFMMTEPLAWLDLTLRKSYLLLGETDNNLISPYFVHNLETTPLLRYFPFEWRSVFIGALLGMLLLAGHRYWGLTLPFVIGLAGVTIIFYAQLRFRLAFMPLILLYTAAFIGVVPRLSRWKVRLALLVLALLYPFLPALGWLILFFMISSLGPYLQRRDWPALHWRALAVWSYLVVAFLLGQVMTFVTQSGQEQAIFRGPQIAGPVAVGQTFVVPCDRFNRVTLKMGTFGFANTKPAIFHLRTGPDSLEDIYRVTFETHSIKDRAPYDFTFPALANSAGQSYFFFIEAPLAAPAESITLRGSYDRPFDRYKPGSIYAGQAGAWQKLYGDAAFQARCEAQPIQLAQQAFQKLAADHFGSAGFYWTVLVSHSLLLLMALFKLWRQGYDPARPTHSFSHRFI